MKDLFLLNKYLKDISRFPLLTAEEEKKYITLAQKGDRGAREKIINSNLRLVVKIAIEFYTGKISIMDIIQSGNLGLIKSISKYNPNKGARFVTYASFWVRQSILRSFVKSSNILSISFRKSEVNKRIKKYIEHYYSKNLGYPSVSKIVKELKVSKKDVLDVLAIFSSNFNTYINKEGEEEDILYSLSDNRFNPEVVVELKSMYEEISKALNLFGEKEKFILKYRFGIDETKKTLKEVGERFSISAEAVRQIEKKALQQMREKCDYLAYYMV